jgi:hypothetical protein
MRLPEPIAKSPLYAFFFKGAIWLVVLTSLWSTVADWTMRPAVSVSYVALKTAFPWWVHDGEYKGDSYELGTRIQVVVANAPPGAKGVLVADCKPARYGYGLPMLLALLLACGSRRLVRNAIIGALALIPFQAFSISFDLLKQVAVEGGAVAAAQTGFSAFSVNAIALGYQLGFLLLPTLVPIMVWLFLERDFLAAITTDRQAPAPQDPASQGPSPGNS